MTARMIMMRNFIRKTSKSWSCKANDVKKKSCNEFNVASIATMKAAIATVCKEMILASKKCKADSDSEDSHNNASGTEKANNNDKNSLNIFNDGDVDNLENNSKGGEFHDAQEN